VSAVYDYGLYNLLRKQSKPVAPHYDLIRAAGSQQYSPYILMCKNMTVYF